jgi:hypothetical protein
MLALRLSQDRVHEQGRRLLMPLDSKVLCDIITVKIG